MSIIRYALFRRPDGWRYRCGSIVSEPFPSQQDAAKAAKIDAALRLGQDAAERRRRRRTSLDAHPSVSPSSR